MKLSAGQLITPGLAFVAGLCVAWGIWHPRPIVEGPAPAVRQSDSSLVLQRAPDAHAAPTMEIPKGATVDRIAQITAQAKPDTVWRIDTLRAEAVIPMPAAIDSLPIVTCPPVVVDLTLARMPDHTTRVIARSPNGVILSGIDIPVSTAALPRTLSWSVGPSYDLSARAWGGGLTRDLGPFRFLGIVSYRPPNIQQGRPGGVGGSVGALIRF